MEQTVSTVSEQPVQVVKTSQSMPAVRTESAQRVYSKKKAIFRFYQVIWYILGLIEVLLAFRVVLKVLGANPYNGFTSFVYGVSNPLALPFSGILSITVVGKSVFEWSTIIAAIVYLLIAYGLVYLLQLIKPASPSEVAENVDNP